MPIDKNLTGDYDYLNIVVRNETTNDAVLKYSETRQAPLIRGIENYQLGIVRFRIPGTKIPLFVFDDDDTGASPYNLILAVMDPGDSMPLAAQVENVRYINAFGSIDKTYPEIPKPQSRFIYYYNSFLSMINAALSDLWTTCTTLPEFAALIGGLPPPVFEKDDKDFVFSFASGAPPNNSFDSQNNTIQHLALFLSPKLFYFFSGFPSMFYSNLQEYRLNLFNFRNDWQGRPNFHTFYPDFSTITQWQHLSRLIVATTVPVRQEFLGIEGDNGANYTQGMLTDFEIQPSPDGIQQDEIYYFTEVPRFLNFATVGDLDRFDLTVYFQTKDNRLFPVLLPPGFESTFKVVFKRKKARDHMQYGTHSYNDTYS